MRDLSGFAEGLRPGGDGVWYAASGEQVSYPGDGHKATLAVEERSFWYRHRNACVLAALRRFPPLGTLFDVGGGNGVVAAALLRAGIDTVLVEPGAGAVVNAQARGIEDIVCATFSSARFRPGALPSIGMFDVAEHVADDALLFREVFHLLQRGGRLYVTVPAYQWLWSPEDKYAGHFRRYRLSTLCEVLVAEGFSVSYASYFFSFLPIPIFLFRSLSSRLGLRRVAGGARAAREHGAESQYVSALMEGALRWEATWVSAGRAIPSGSSLLLVAQRSG